MGAEKVVPGGAEAFGVLGSAGAGSFGTAGSRTGAAGVGTVTEGTVGTGIESARASPARSPTPAQNNATTAPFITLSFPSGSEFQSWSPSASDSVGNVLN